MSCFCTNPENDLESSSVSSVGDLLASVRRLPSSKNWWFRGHSSLLRYRLEPQVFRHPLAQEVPALPREQDLLHRFRARGATRYAKCPDYQNRAAWLSLAQHYRLPTRLLDWTRSPLVAAYFALEAYIYQRGGEPRQTEDAAIWALEPFLLNGRECQHRHTPSIESAECDALLAGAFEAGAYAGLNTVRAVMSSEQDLRMFVQQGCFTIHTRAGALEARPGSETYLRRWRIPSAAIELMKDEIEIAGFRKGDIYPDLEHLAAELSARWREPAGSSAP